MKLISVTLCIRFDEWNTAYMVINSKTIKRMISDILLLNKKISVIKSKVPPTINVLNNLDRPSNETPKMMAVIKYILK